MHIISAVPPVANCNNRPNKSGGTIFVQNITNDEEEKHDLPPIIPPRPSPVKLIKKNPSLILIKPKPAPVVDVVHQTTFPPGTVICTADPKHLSDAKIVPKLPILPIFKKQVITSSIIGNDRPPSQIYTTTLEKNRIETPKPKRIRPNKHFDKNTPIYAEYRKKNNDSVKRSRAKKMLYYKDIEEKYYPLLDNFKMLVRVCADKEAEINRLRSILFANGIPF